MSNTDFTDVVVCGAGPVGLLIALGLAQQGIDTLIVEKRDRNVQETFGRACTLYPRTMELLEQLDLTGEMTQAGFIGRSYAAYKDGKRVVRKAWQSMFPYMDQSFHNYILNIRQKQSEHIFASRYQNLYDKRVQYGWNIVDYKVDTSPEDDYNVTVSMFHASLGSRTVRCKYLVGADGGQSTVRQVADIVMEGNETTYKWVRIDGRMKTNMPEPNLVFAALETKNHGNVLWAKLDKDAYRIGYALTPSLQVKYPDGPNEEQAIQEAMDALQPFKLEIERVDWWTCYSVKQKVAETLHKDDYILLAGDAAHTHSSGFAQGMNTGVHDATNLSWKLAGTLKGWYKPDVLATYATERHAAAQKLISIDRLVAAAISGEISAEQKGLGLSAEDALHSILQTNMSFTIGLGISYEASAISKEPNATTLLPGTRSPDALLYVPGPSVPIRLHSITHQESKGRWSLLVFAGNHHMTRPGIIALREIMNREGSSLQSWNHIYRMSTIVTGVIGSAWDAFDGPALGNLYFDLEAIAHSRFGVYPDHGALVVIRPDGVFAFATGLDKPDQIEEFFNAICR